MVQTVRERRRTQTRQEIIDSAWALCREGGLAALSMRELGSRAGLSAPSVYSYFGSKNEIYDAMFAQGQLELAEQLAFLPESRVTRADFRRGAHAFFDFCVADPVRYQLMFQRTVPGFEPSPATYALAVAQVERMARQMTSAGVTDQRHPDLWTALLSGLTAQQISNDPDGDRWQQLLDEAVDVFCDHAGIPPELPGKDSP
ncbi:MAG: Transcriptional regulator, TetR family [Pseudonocardia sp.]|nr:Transcriptional regulator, TetR family [Pseudonocardia sp.]